MLLPLLREYQSAPYSLHPKAGQENKLLLHLQSSYLTFDAPQYFHNFVDRLYKLLPNKDSFYIPAVILTLNTQHDCYK
jgi:hypothetical protein